MSNQTMHARNAISGAQAECYKVINGQRFKMMNAISLEANFEKTKVELPILGRAGKGNKSTGIKYTGSCKLYFNDSSNLEMLTRFKNEGVDDYFDLVVRIEDKTTEVGALTVILKDVNFDNGNIIRFDADDEYLTEELDFTFEDYEAPELFKKNIVVVEQ